MKSRITLLSCTLFINLFVFKREALSQQTPTASVYTEAGKLIKAPQAFASLGPNLFGDTVNLYSGALEFVQTDVSLPGNNALPVSVGRRLSTGNWANSTGAFGRWELEIPRLHGVFGNAGWTTKASNKNRCTEFGAPAGVMGTGGVAPWSADEFWHGNFIYVPGVGDQEMLLRNPANPNVPTSGGPYPVVTRDLWAFSCLTTLANDATGTMGQGFLAVAPDGTRYRFDHLVTRNYEGVSRSEDASTGMNATSSSPGVLPGPTAAPCCGLPRKEVWILPTRITDRYGNYVTYTYSPTKPGNVTSIASSDGRTLTLTYTTDAFGDRIDTVFDGARTWNYDYHPSNGQFDLDRVTLPDGSKWIFTNTEPLLSRWRYVGSGSCDTLSSVADGPKTGTMVHPSGAIGQFTLTPVRHGRSQTFRQCRGDASVGDYPVNPHKYDTYSLTSKTLSGPGLAATTWSYDFGPDNGSWEGCVGCPETVTTTLTEPNGELTHYTYGNRYMHSEGQLLSVDTAGLRTVTTSYRDAAAGPYPNPPGTSDQKRGDSSVRARLTPVDQRVTTQQGVDFKWKADSFDVKARPVKVTRSSSLGTRIESTAYFDQTASWVLGQVDSLTVALDGKNIVLVKNGYNATTANLESVTRFGLLKQKMTYNTDGTVATRSDPLDRTTRYSNYKRGIPRNVERADLTKESAEVDDLGNIVWITDANGHQTRLAYDSQMHRLASITPPADTGIAWNPTTITFAPMPSSEFGMDGGLWRQEVTTGSARVSTYLDALWRPIRIVTYDINDFGRPAQMVKKSYDFAGRTSFASYPQADQSKLDIGVHSEYDALSRLTESRSDSELGVLVSTVAFGNPFTKTQTDARGNWTRTSFQAFDTPSEEAITGIVAPVDVNVTLNVAIARDVFGKPRSITKSGGGVSAIRSYVYDPNERLCKTIEPETGGEIVDYDAADNVSWRAPGLALTSQVCDRASVAVAAKISFGYDAMNRLLSTTYGTGAAPITRTFWPDGLPKTVVSGGATWTLDYNNRRLPTTETLNFGGANYTLTSSYDANGHLSQLQYPSAGNPIGVQSVAHAPDAFGRPTRVGNFATGISYYANGAIAGFTYGNGKVHSMSQNTRNLPELSADSLVLRDRYRYDQNGNVASITDELQNVSTRTLGYDALDRLKTANAPGLWGAASYTYDVLDNIRSSTVGNRVSSFTYGARNLLDTLSSTSASFGFIYTYDARGNVTKRGTQEFVFDQGNRLTSAPNRATYVYDGFGRRVRTTAVDGTVTVSVYSPAGQLLYTRRSGGPNPAASTQYIYLHNHQIAEVKR